MRFYLQFGHGMMDLTRELLGRGWLASGVVLSPRDLEVDQLRRMVETARGVMAEPLLDPQCYVHDGDYPGLLKHEYFRVFREHSTNSLAGAAATGEILGTLAKNNRFIGINRHILPGLLATTVTDDWFAFQEAFINAAPNHFGDEPVLATIALSSEAVLDEAQVEAVVDRAAGWNVAGFYVVAETPSTYLVDNAVWLGNLLGLVAGLKLLHNKFVLVGYCNHQMLALAATRADVIASGSWLNVRALQQSKFYVAPDDESRRTTWYYCPQALSEYKIPALDLAQQRGLLDRMKPDAAMESEYAAPLFSGVLPSLVDWKEGKAFRHYLTCLHAQVQTTPSSSFQATLDDHRRQLDRAEQILTVLHEQLIKGGDRDFKDRLDINRAALVTLDRTRGPRLRRAW